MVEKPIKFKDILFFDDMWHNVAKVKKLGVHAVKVDEKQGVDYSYLQTVFKVQGEILSSEMLHRYFFKVKLLSHRHTHSP